MIRKFFVIIAYFLVAYFVFHTFMVRWSFIEYMLEPRYANGDPGRGGNSFQRIVEYKALEPFAYRVLIPSLVNWSSQRIPQQIVQRHKKWLLDNSPIVKRYLKSRIEWDLRMSVRYHLMFLYTFLAVFLVLVTGRSLTKFVFPRYPQVVWDWAPIVGLLCLPTTFWRGGYFYDFFELLLMNICLILILKKEWVLYYAFFVLAVLNKESNLLILFFFLAFRIRDLRQSELWRHIFTHLMIGGALIIVMRSIFAANPGGAMWVFWKTNLQFWFTSTPYFATQDIFRIGIPIPTGGNFILILTCLFLVVYGWDKKPDDIKRLFLYSACINLPLFFYASWMDEIRNLSLIFPSLYLLSVWTVCSIFKCSPTQNSLLMNTACRPSC